MNRREFIAFAGGMTMWPTLAKGQSDHVPRIAAFISGQTVIAEGFAKAFSDQLDSLGWTPGRKISIDYRWLRDGRLSADAEEVVALSPRVIVAGGTEATKALQARTRTIPIVFVHVADPLAAGLVESLARPAGNITGLAAYEASIGSKWLEVLKEAVPDMMNVLVLVDKQNPTWQMHVPMIERAALVLNVKMTPANVHTAQDIELAIETFAQQAKAGLIVLPSLMFDNQHRTLITSLCIKYRLPAIAATRGWIAWDGFLYYSSNWVDLYRRSAEYVDKILKGARPSDLSVQQPTRFEMVINLKTAKALGISVPAALLARADEVIE